MFLRSDLNTGGTELEFLNGWKKVCVSAWGWGYLRIEHKAPQDTDALFLVAYVCLYLFWELTHEHIYEHMDHKAAKPQRPLTCQ